MFRLLEKLSDVRRLGSLMIMWRIWYARNEIMHNKTSVPTEGSWWFLSSYITSVLAIEQHPAANLIKGKRVINYYGGKPKTHRESQSGHSGNR